MVGSPHLESHGDFAVSIFVQGHEYKAVTVETGSAKGVTVAIGLLPSGSEGLLDDLRQGRFAKLRVNDLSMRVSLKGSTAALAAYDECVSAITHQ